jgi:hypothetical protein
MNGRKCRHLFGIRSYPKKKTHQSVVLARHQFENGWPSGCISIRRWCRVTQDTELFPKLVEFFMSQIYEWQQTYLAAICETDDEQLPARILEARSAIEQRLLSTIEADELTAIENARKALEMLQQEYEQRKGHWY